MSTDRQLPPAEFSRSQRRARVPALSRVAGAVLTCLVYALFALLLWLQSFAAPPDAPTLETIAILLPDTARRKPIPLPPPFLAHLVRPRLETIAPPTFTIASAAPLAPALLPASAARTSPIEGGVPAGTGTKGAGVSANGGNGNGKAVAGCYDEAWGRAVSQRVGRFFYYPGGARADHATGLTMVHFIVRRDGLLDLLEIGKSSGDRVLDDAAYDMVRKAQPLPRMPDRMHLDWIDLQLPINFGLADLHLQPSPGSCG